MISNIFFLSCSLSLPRFIINVSFNPEIICQRKKYEDNLSMLRHSLGISRRLWKEASHYATKRSTADWVTSRFYFGTCYWLLTFSRKCETKVRHWLNLLVSRKHLTLTWTSLTIEMPRFLQYFQYQRTLCQELSLSPTIIPCHYFQCYFHDR